MGLILFEFLHRVKFKYVIKTYLGEILFDIYKDKKGKFRFRLKAKNGEIICSGQAYTSKASCVKGINSLITNAKKKKSFQLQKNRAGKHFFNVVAGNNKVIATSQSYKTENALNKGVESVRKNATKKNLK